MNGCLTIKRDNLIDFSFCFFFSMPFWIKIVETVLEYADMQSMARMLCIFITYLPVVYALLTSRKYKLLDFIVILFFVVCSFCVSYLIHPEYDYVYSRELYGVLPYVLRPDNGLYAYLFIRLVDDPKRILKNLKLSSWLMYVYFGIRIARALKRGYWEQQGTDGSIVQMSYNLSLGYDILLYMFTFLYAGLKERNLINLAAAGVGAVMILVAGSRGPFLNMGIFALLYMMICFRKSSRKRVYIIAALVCIPLLLLTYSSILLWVSDVLDSLGISSRFVKMMVKGNVTSTNTREPIWAAAINMIRENPFGYGPMGTRHVIINLHNVGHPHQFFLEILVDWGVIAGSAFILYIAYHAFRIFMMDDMDDWRAVFLIFFCRACQLLISLTYWHISAFWACLAIGASVYQQRRKNRRRITSHG